MMLDLLTDNHYKYHTLINGLTDRLTDNRKFGTIVYMDGWTDNHRRTGKVTIDELI